MKSKQQTWGLERWFGSLGQSHGEPEFGPTLGGSQLPIAVALGDLALNSVLCGYPHMGCTYGYSGTHTYP